MSGQTDLINNQWKELTVLTALGLEPISILLFNSTVWKPKLKILTSTSNPKFLSHIKPNIQSRFHQKS
jgi:hypothetical protein